MKKILNFLLPMMVVVGLSNCAPSDAVVQTAIAKTLETNPTAINHPTNTPEPTTTITPTSTSTPSATPTPTRALGIGSISVSEKDGMVMMYVPAGEFLMGSDRVEDYEPEQNVSLDSFWIDQTEVTNKMYSICVESGECIPPSSFSSRSRTDYFGNPEFDIYPVVYVTWNDAETYCNWAGKQLPTDAQWEKAARGTDGRPFPWGERLPASVPYGPDSPSHREFKWGFVEKDLLNFISLIRDTSRVANYPNGASPYGALDMGGNVAEWVGYSNFSTEEDQESTKETRGGFFNSNRESVHVTSNVHYPPNESQYFIGFRCIQEAK